MFRNRVEKTLFTDVLGENPPRRITGSLYDISDAVFDSVLKALLYPRMSEEDELTIGWSRVRSSSPYGGGDDAGEKRDYLFGKVLYDDSMVSEKNRFTFINTGSRALFDFLKNNFEELTGFKRVEKITLFYQKSFDVLCFVSAENRSTIVVLMNGTLEMIHYLGVSILTMFPWYFDPKKGITELEKKLLESLRERTQTKFLECMKEYEEVYDIKTLFLKKLEGFEEQVERKEVSRIESDIQYFDSEIANLEARIREHLISRRRLEGQLLGFKMGVSETKNELMNYFKVNKHVCLENVYDNKITFVTKAFADNFDSDMAETIINNPNSFAYEHNTLPHEDVKMLLEAVFVDRTIKLQFCEAFDLDTTGNVQPRGGYSYGSRYSDCTPNPHIDAYSCLGDYRQQITECIKARNYIGVIELCIASASSINWGDSPVMTEFFKRLYGKTQHKMQCFITPECEILDVKGAIEYLKGVKEEDVDG